MPTWTLDETMSYATKRIGRRGDISLSDASFWANQAYSEVAQATNHALLESKTIISLNSGDSLATLPADFLEIIDISLSTTLGSSYTLLPTSPEWADAQGYYPLGQPEKYFIYGDQVQFWPSANSSAATTVWSGRSYEVRYRARAEDLVSLTSVPSLDTELRWAWVLRTEAFYHQLLNNDEEAAVKIGEYFGYVGSLKDAIARRQAARGRFAASLPLRKGRRG